MPRRSSDGIPGTVYAKGGYLYLRVDGKVEALRMKDTPRNRKLAQTVKRDRFISAIRGVMPASTVSWATAYEAFLADKPNMAAKTRTQHGLAFRKIVNHPDAAIGDARRVAMQWDHGDLSPVSVANYLRHFRVFARWAARRYGLPEPDFSGLMPRLHWQEPETFTAAELIAIFDSGHKYTPLWEFMVLTGARPVDAMNPITTTQGKQGVVWVNKVSKSPEPRPVCTRAWALIPQIFDSPYSRIRSVSLSFERIQRRVGIRPRPMKILRTTFLRIIDPLPWNVQTWLMRHHSGGVTETHYKAYDWADVIGKVDECVKIFFSPL